MIEVGVARPKAHGQAIIRIVIKIVNANKNVAPKTKYQRPNASNAIAITAHTKYPEITSARRAIGAFEP